jgi:hypothetical protein
MGAVGWYETCSKMTEGGQKEEAWTVVTEYMCV